MKVNSSSSFSNVICDSLCTSISITHWSVHLQRHWHFSILSPSSICYCCINTFVLFFSSSSSHHLICILTFILLMNLQQINVLCLFLFYKNNVYLIHDKCMIFERFVTQCQDHRRNTKKYDIPKWLIYSFWITINTGC